LVGQNKRFLVRKEKTDRTKRSRRSDGEVSLDNADAVIEGALVFRLLEGWGFDCCSSVGNRLSPLVTVGRTKSPALEERQGRGTPSSNPELSAPPLLL